MSYDSTYRISRIVCANLTPMTHTPTVISKYSTWLDTLRRHKDARIRYDYVRLLILGLEQPMPTSVCPFNDYPPEKIEPLVGDDWTAAARHMFFDRQVRIRRVRHRYVIEINREPLLWKWRSTEIDGKLNTKTVSVFHLRYRVNTIPSLSWGTRLGCNVVGFWNRRYESVHKKRIYRIRNTLKCSWYNLVVHRRNERNPSVYWMNLLNLSPSWRALPRANVRVM